jgi:hypothetical protein
MEKTAVDWLVDHLYWVIPDSERNFLEGLREEALKKEKEQIIDAYNNGQQIPPFEYAEFYYNQTYNQNK